MSRAKAPVRRALNRRTIDSVTTSTVTQTVTNGVPTVTNTVVITSTEIAPTPANIVATVCSPFRSFTSEASADPLVQQVTEYTPGPTVTIPVFTAPTPQGTTSTTQTITLETPLATEVVTVTNAAPTPLATVTTVAYVQSTTCKVQVDLVSSSLRRVLVVQRPADRSHPSTGAEEVPCWNSQGSRAHRHRRADQGEPICGTTGTFYY